MLLNIDKFFQVVEWSLQKMRCVLRFLVESLRMRKVWTTFRRTVRVLNLDRERDALDWGNTKIMHAIGRVKDFRVFFW